MKSLSEIYNDSDHENIISENLDFCNQVKKGNILTEHKKIVKKKKSTFSVLDESLSSLEDDIRTLILSQ
jgi:hypothetical protein